MEDLNKNVSKWQEDSCQLRKLPFILQLMNKTFDMSNQNFLGKPRLNSIKEEDILFFSLFMDDKRINNSID